MWKTYAHASARERRKREGVNKTDNRREKVWFYFLSFAMQIFSLNSLSFFSPSHLEVRTEACPWRKKQADNHRRRSAEQSCQAKSQVCAGN